MCLGLAVPVSAADEFSVWDGSVETDWLKDTEMTHTIDSAAKLAGLAQLTNELAVGGNTGAYEGHTFYITVNIDLNGIEWIPIGFTYGNNFAGNLEGRLGGVAGQAATIKNLVITDNTDHGNTGFIGTLRGGSVKNLTFINAKVTYPQGGAQGVVVGYISKVITAIENIKVIDSLVSAAEPRDVIAGTGGVIGFAKVDAPLSFKNVAFINGTVDAYSEDAGGIIGHIKVNVENGNYTFENCYVSGKVTGDPENAGGVVGRMNRKADTDVFTMKNVQAENMTVTSFNAAGSLVGNLNGATLVIENTLVVDSTAAVGKNSGNIEAKTGFANKDDEYCRTVSNSDMIGLAAKDALPGFDFGGLWIARVGKTPILTIARSAADVNADAKLGEPTAGAPGSAATTFDFTIIAVTAAIASAAGYMLTKKR